MTRGETLKPDWTTYDHADADSDSARLFWNEVDLGGETFHRKSPTVRIRIPLVTVFQCSVRRTHVAYMTVERYINYDSIILYDPHPEADTFSVHSSVIMLRTV